MYTVEYIRDLLIKDPVKKTIIFPEGPETKIQTVATNLVTEKIANTILIFKTKSEVPANLHPEIKTIVIDEFDKQPLIDKFLELRKEKTNLEQATKLMNHPNYIGVMLVKMQQADAMLSGLTYTTADTIRPALQIVKIKPGISLATTVFIMKKDNNNFFFTDCALNIKPSSEQLADITKMTIDFAKSLDVQNPEAALLSYSTNGSGAGEDVDRVANAVNILKTQDLDFKFAGEMQFDAAFDKTVRDKKFADCPLTKQTPDVFVFPDISSGNIGYKIAQRMGGYEAIGPFILGFNQPVNDLSRGATLEDIMNTAIMTVYQAKGNK